MAQKPFVQVKKEKKTFDLMEFDLTTISQQHKSSISLQR